MVIIGGGVIGLELGSVWRRLGAQVTVIEFLDQILPGMDSDIVKQFARSLKKQGFAFKLSSKVLSAEKSGKKRKVVFENVKNGKQDEIEARRRPGGDWPGAVYAGPWTGRNGHRQGQSRPYRCR